MTLIDKTKSTALHLIFIILTVSLTSCTHINESHAQQNRSDISEHIQKISDTFYVIIGNDQNGANSGILFSSNGALLIDSMEAEFAPKIFTWIRSKTDKPIKYVINTHNHQDHSGGNTFWIQQGATLISHENSQKIDTLSAEVSNKILSLFFGNEKIEIHTAPGHTHNDVFVFLKNHNMLFMGDNYSNDWVPISRLLGQKNQIIPYAITLTDPNTRVVPGHGSIVSQNKLVEYNKYLPLWFNLIMLNHKNGLSVDEIISEPQFLNLSKKFNPGNVLGKVPQRPHMKNIVSSVLREIPQEASND